MELSISSFEKLLLISSNSIFSVVTVQFAASYFFRNTMASASYASSKHSLCYGWSSSWKYETKSEPLGPSLSRLDPLILSITDHKLALSYKNAFSHAFHSVIVVLPHFRCLCDRYSLHFMIRFSRSVSHITLSPALTASDLSCQHRLSNHRGPRFYDIYIYIYNIVLWNAIQLKICAEYRDMLPRPRLVCMNLGWGRKAEAQVYLTNPAEAWVACPGILHRS